ncbi:MAG: hypothetical protein M0P69_14270 [Bacteroidales bacterium]|nr:hypothetical protein [Bacteroidales bacterium]
MAEIFKETPRQGMPFCTPGLMDGLARLEYAIKNIKGEGCEISWSGLGAPMITVKGVVKGEELPDIDVITSVKGFGVTQRSGGQVIFLNFGTTNLKTGEAGADDNNDLALTAKSLVELVSYGGTPPAFKQAMITVQTLGAAAGVTEEIVELESHASQHVEE